MDLRLCWKKEIDIYQSEFLFVSLILMIYINQTLPFRPKGYIQLYPVGWFLKKRRSTLNALGYI